MEFSVRHARNAYIVMLVLVVVGAISFLPGASEMLGRSASSHAGPWMGAILLLLSTVAGLMTILWMRRDAKRMTAEINQMTHDGKYTPLRAGTSDWARLCGALNGMIAA